MEAVQGAREATSAELPHGIWTGLAWCLGILIVAYAVAMATHHRKAA